MSVRASSAKAVSVQIEETRREIGYLETDASEFQQYRSNMHVEPTVNTTDYGWLCSCYDPVLDSEGNAIVISMSTPTTGYGKSPSRIRKDLPPQSGH